MNKAYIPLVFVIGCGSAETINEPVEVSVGQAPEPNEALEEIPIPNVSDNPYLKRTHLNKIDYYDQCKEQCVFDHTICLYHCNNRCDVARTRCRKACDHTVNVCNYVCTLN